VAPDDPELLRTIATADADAGEAVAARCQACHTFERGGAAGVGPNLFDIVGANIARSAGFNYSAAFRILGTEGATWTYTLLDDFLRSPALAILGNRMGFAGVADDDDRADLIAFLRRLSNDPMPLPGFRGESAVEAAAPPLPAGFNPLEFTRGQAEVGRDAYVNLGCAACHGVTLTGTADGPALVGDAFAAAWFGGTVYALFDRLRSTMPPNNPAGLDDPRYAELLAYILEQNGYVVRGRPLRTDPAVLEITRFIQPD
jgi:cytochrome c2